MWLPVSFHGQRSPSKFESTLKWNMSHTSRFVIFQYINWTSRHKILCQTKQSMLYQWKVSDLDFWDSFKRWPLFRGRLKWQWQNWNHDYNSAMSSTELNLILLIFHDVLLYLEWIWTSLFIILDAFHMRLSRRQYNHLVTKLFALTFYSWVSINKLQLLTINRRVPSNSI